MANAGRPDVYRTNIAPFIDQIPIWYKTMTVRQIAKKLGVSKTTLYKYAKENKELATALAGGKADLVDDLKSALKKRALGYTYEDTTTKITTSREKGTEVVTTTKTVHILPDPASIHMLLKNLDPNWHNDDAATLELKRKELALKEKRIEAETW